jgi:exopolysaccharide biosynthesis polyprenyl glycosylphosphotransferase
MLLGADLVGIIAAGLLAAWLRFGTIFAVEAFENAAQEFSFIGLTLLVAPVWLLVLWLAGLYDLDRVTWGAADAGRITRALSLGVVALILGTYLLKAPGLSRGWVLLFWLLAVVFVLSGRAIISLVVIVAHRKGRLLQPTLVVGSNRESADIIRLLTAHIDAGLVPIGCLASSQAERLQLDYCSSDVPVLGHAREIPDIVVRTGVHTVVIASSAFDHDVLARMVAELRDLDVDVHISSGLFEVLTSRVLVNEVAGVPLITVKGISLSRGKLLVKRTFDLVVAGLVLVVGLPLWVAVAVAIKLTSPGPVFYGQPRVGRNGTRFAMLKFRSMYQDAEKRLAELRAVNEASGPLFKMKDDPRVTSVGRWMRKFSIDEFPQLINVMRGEMSLVGPRPPLPAEVERYSAQDWRRLEVTPGMTGLWQISGRSSLTFDEMVRLDLFYIENWSVALDLTIIMRTVPAVLLARGAY